MSHSAWILEVFQDNTPLTDGNLSLLMDSSRRERKLPKNILLQTDSPNPALGFVICANRYPWSLVNFLRELDKCQGINYKYF